MPRAFRTLRREAQRTTTARGHRMQWAPTLVPTIVIGTCHWCHMQVALNRTPQPNEIEIGGEAVALNCTGRFR